MKTGMVKAYPASLLYQSTLADFPASRFVLFCGFYDALWGELNSQHREICDRFYSIFRAHEFVSASLTPMPENLIRSVRDLGIIESEQTVEAVLSPTTISRSLDLADAIDFDLIESLLAPLYPDPDCWTDAELSVTDWKHQAILQDFHRFNPFGSLMEAMAQAKVWRQSLVTTANSGSVLC